MKVTVTVNGSEVAAEVADRTLLVHFVRDVAGLTATNVGCDTSSCGACTVLLDGRSVKSCTVLAAQADGREVVTVEGLSDGTGELHPVQRAFRAEHGLQCGFCTPGMVMASVSLLAENPAPTEDEVRTALEGQPVPLHGLPQHRQGGSCRRQREAATVIPAPFTYKRAATVDEALGPGRRGRRGREVPGRRPFADAADEASPGRARDASSTSAGSATSATSARTTATSRSARSPATTTWRDRTCYASTVAAAGPRRRAGRRSAGQALRHHRRFARARRPGR